jgi:shikimate kinase
LTNRQYQFVTAFSDYSMKNIFLIGLPSSGKSTLGKKLARLLNYRFVDMDKLIEKDQGMTVHDIFTQKGEDYFRIIESRILRATLENRKVVIATGGGAPCFFDNMDFIKKSGISIFLDVHHAELARRIQNHGKDDRPLLSGASSLEAELEKKYQQRLPYYSQADFTISGDSDATKLAAIVQPLI